MATVLEDLDVLRWDPSRPIQDGNDWEIASARGECVAGCLGLASNDRLISFSGYPLITIEDVLEALAAMMNDTELALTVDGSGGTKTLRCEIVSL